MSDAIASATPFRLHPGWVWDSEDFKEEGNLTPSWMLSCCEYLFFLEEQLRDSEAGEPEPNSKRARTQEPSVTISLLDEIHIDLYTDEDVASMDIIGDDPVPKSPPESITIVASDDDSSDEVQVVSMKMPRSLFLDKWTRRASFYGISPYCFQNLYLAGAPPILFNSLRFLHTLSYH